MKTFRIGILISAVILSGCANTLDGSIRIANKNFDQEFSAYRYIQTEEETTHISYELKAAGEPAETIASNSPDLLKDLFKGFQSTCSFSKEELIETRVVYHKAPLFYEVWVFNDELSERADKTSALSVILTADSTGTDINIKGNCHGADQRIVLGK
ncbi:MAG: hypothetical protein ACI808_002608 [Paraglaciecola sp.]|jgi:hypothetical protein